MTRDCLLWLACFGLAIDVVRCFRRIRELRRELAELRARLDQDGGHV